MRKLARVVKIDSIEPIANADRIEVAGVGGWRVVIKKGEYQPGDLAIYIEIDAFLPEGNPLWQFLMEKSIREYEGVRGHVLRSVKLRGVVSQGLLLPPIGDYPLDSDLTEVLGISKYEPPIPAQLAGIVKRMFPRVIPKTEQERIQNLADRWEEIKTKSYEVTEKLDGSSMTLYLLNREFGVCSRNLDLKRDEHNTLWQVAIAQDLETKLRAAFEDNIAVQGELIGEGIQGNIYRIKGHQFLVYDIYDIKNNQYFRPEARRLICEQAGIPHVPIEQEDLSLAQEPDWTIDNLLSIANGHSQLGNHPKREGLVFKLTGRTEGTERSGEIISFKVISNDYLLKRAGG